MSLRTLSIPAVVFALIVSMTGPASAVYQVGDHVNNFTLPNAYGQQISLYDYQDCIVMMPFWFFE